MPVIWAWVCSWHSGYPLWLKNSIEEPGIAVFFRYRSVPNICLWSAVLHVASLWWEVYLSSSMRSLYHPVLEAADCLFKKNQKNLEWVFLQWQHRVLSPKIQKLCFLKKWVLFETWEPEKLQLGAACCWGHSSEKEGKGKGLRLWRGCLKLSLVL